MKIFLSNSYVTTVQGELLGYVGENNSREILLYGFETEGASRYVIIFSYLDGAQYEADITRGQYTIPASILREPGTVDLQIVALTPSGEYIKKSNVFKGVIAESINGESAPIPPYEDVEDMYEQILESAENAVKASEEAVEASEKAKESADAAKQSEDLSHYAANSARESAKAAENQARGAAASLGMCKEAEANAKTSADTAKTNADISTEAKDDSEQSRAAAETAATTALTSANSAQESERVVTAAKTSIDTTAQTVATQAAEVSRNAETVSADRQAAENAKDVAVAKSQEIADSAAQIKQNVADIKALRTDVDNIQDIMGGAFLDSWADIQRIVRVGQAAKQIKIGDQFVCGKTVDGVTQRLVWDVIGIDQDIPRDPRFTHSLTLQLHDLYTTMPFCVRQALFAFPDGLTAGAYKFTIGEQPWFAGDVDKIIAFTLTQDIPAGGQLVINNAFNASMIGATISAFASNLKTTAIETAIMSEGTAGIDLGTVVSDLNGNTNSIHRALLGSNNWAESDIRQWLNSDKSAGQVWKPLTIFSRPPAWTANTAGFLYGLDPGFLAALGSVKKTTALNTVTDGGGSVVTDDKVFLPSRSEVYGGNEGGINEGEPYAYYANYSDLTAAGTSADTNRIKYRNGTAQYWRLRSPNVRLANYVCNVRQTGAVNISSAGNSLGVVIVVCID